MYVSYLISMNIFTFLLGGSRSRLQVSQQKNRMGAAASLEGESPDMARKRAAGKIRDSLFLAQRDLRRRVRRRSSITLNSIREEKEKTSSEMKKKKKRRISLIDQRVIDRAKGILKDEAFSNTSLNNERRRSSLCPVKEKEKEERRLSFGEQMLNMLTQEWTGRISRENSSRQSTPRVRKNSFEDLLANSKKQDSKRSLRQETLTNVRKILWDNVNESPVPHKSSMRRNSLLLAAQNSARRIRRESITKYDYNNNDDGDGDRKTETSPVNRAARRSSIRRFGSRRSSMNSLRKLSKIAMNRSTDSLIGRMSSSDSYFGDDDSKS